MSSEIFPNGDSQKRRPSEIDREAKNIIFKLKGLLIPNGFKPSEIPELSVTKRELAIAHFLRLLHLIHELENNGSHLAIVLADSIKKNVIFFSNNGFEKIIQEATLQYETTGSAQPKSDSSLKDEDPFDLGDTVRTVLTEKTVEEVSSLLPPSSSTSDLPKPKESAQPQIQTHEDTRWSPPQLEVREVGGSIEISLVVHCPLTHSKNQEAPITTKMITSFLQSLLQEKGMNTAQLWFTELMKEFENHPKLQTDKRYRITFRIWYDTTKSHSIEFQYQLVY